MSIKAFNISTKSILVEGTVTCLVTSQLADGEDGGGRVGGGNGGGVRLAHFLSSAFDVVKGSS